MKWFLLVLTLLFALTASANKKAKLQEEEEVVMEEEEVVEEETGNEEEVTGEEEEEGTGEEEVTGEEEEEVTGEEEEEVTGEEEEVTGEEEEVTGEEEEVTGEEEEEVTGEETEEEVAGEGETFTATKTITELISESADHTVLYSLLKKIGYDKMFDKVKKDDMYTVFAPTDAAFQRISADELKALKDDKEMIEAILGYHVIEGAVMSDDLQHCQTPKTVQGEMLLIRHDDYGVSLNDLASTVNTDMVATNGIIHTIDFPLMPRSTMRCERMMPSECLTEYGCKVRKNGQCYPIRRVCGYRVMQ